MVKELTSGPITESTRETGSTTKCTAPGSSLGMMVENIKESIRTIGLKARVSSLGPMAESMKEGGRTGSKTALGNMEMLMEKKDTGYGRMGRD